MVLYVYDPQMQMLGILEEITSLVWTRRYWDVGEFKLLVPFNTTHNQLLQTGNIIIRHGDNEAAEIQYISISKNLEGFEVIEAQGKFLTHWLSSRVIAKPLANVSATAQTLIRRLVNENCISTGNSKRVIPRLSLNSDATIIGSAITYTSEDYENLLDAVIDLAQSAKLGFKMITSRDTGMHKFSVYKGTDYSAENTAGNPPCVFSQEYDNVLGQEYTKSTEKYKNTVYVTGEEKKDEETDEIITPELVIVGDSNTGLERREMYVNAGNIKQTYKDDNGEEVTLTLTQYRQALTDRGEEKKEQYIVAQSFSSDINAGANLIYREDFDVGDRTTCVNVAWNVRIDARITEATETYEKDGERLEITFGESMPSVYRQIKAMTNGGK